MTENQVISDFELALEEADPSVPLHACPRWAEFQQVSPDHNEFFAGYMVASRGRGLDTSTAMTAAGGRYALRSEAG